MAQADSYPATGNGARAQDMAQGRKQGRKLGARRKTAQDARKGARRKPSQAKPSQGRKAQDEGAKKARH